MRQRVVIKWGISSFFAWGIFGLNLALHWAEDADIEPVAGCHIAPETISVDPLRRRTLDNFIDLSAAFERQLQAMSNVYCEAHLPVLVALNADFQNLPDARGNYLVGQPTVGVVVFETAQLDADAVARARRLPVIVAASDWNRRVMLAHGLANVVTVLQGVDPTLFHPAPTSGLFGNRFCIFSGGKLEYRKGQDIVLAAFRRFASRHPEALLVTLWQSPWPQVARTLDCSSLVAPVPVFEDGRVDVLGWAAANGIDTRQVLDLGTIPNAQMAMVLREMDVAAFPNRCEGGTNQVAMECMACGVPVILSENTGHLDLIDDDNCYPLHAQTPLAGIGAGFGAVPGWGETDVDELDDVLERVFVDREAAEQRGRRAAETLSDLTWARTAGRMKQVVLAHC
jgi:glycosyltransferase involved in cell wall biosynthesis